MNLLTRSNRNVELLIGIATGEILLLEIFSQRTKIFKTVIFFLFQQIFNMFLKFYLILFD